MVTVIELTLGESLMIGDDIEVSYAGRWAWGAKLAFAAPRHVTIDRAEVRRRRELGVTQHAIDRYRERFADDEWLPAQTAARRLVRIASEAEVATGAEAARVRCHDGALVLIHRLHKMVLVLDRAERRVLTVFAWNCSPENP
jgi:sRNA-binding carbon storage regulator CsrA